MQKSGDSTFLGETYHSPPRPGLPLQGLLFHGFRQRRGAGSASQQWDISYTEPYPRWTTALSHIRSPSSHSSPHVGPYKTGAEISSFEQALQMEIIVSHRPNPSFGPKRPLGGRIYSKKYRKSRFPFPTPARSRSSIPKGGRHVQEVQSSVTFLYHSLGSL